MLIVPEIFCLVRKGAPVVFSELWTPFAFPGMNLPDSFTRTTTFDQTFYLQQWRSHGNINIRTYISLKIFLEGNKKALTNCHLTY